MESSKRRSHPMALPAKYLEAEQEAKRFLAKIEALRKRWREDDQFADRMDIIGGPETSAVKRASLDLSRALSVLRRR